MKRSKEVIDYIVNIFGSAVVIVSIIEAIWIHHLGRSLWLDEAYLAESILTRSFGTLTTHPLENLQSAPIVYLYIVKILTVIFGPAEQVLRCWSTISYIAVLALIYYLGKKALGLRFPILPAAMLANMPHTLYYSNELKQYMQEGFWVLLLLVIYDWYISNIDKGKKAVVVLIICCMTFIWASNPACFMIGGILLVEFFRGILTKNKKLSIYSILAGIGTMISFVGYYLYWLKPVASSEEMQDYWDGKIYYVIPTSLADIEENYDSFSTLLKETMRNLTDDYPVVYYFVVISIFLLFITANILYLKEKNYVGCAMGYGIVVALVASNMSMFPMSERLWNWVYPIFFIDIVYSLDYIMKKMGRYRAAGWMLAIYAIAYICLNQGVIEYSKIDSAYRDEYEVNPLVAYVSENIGDDESCYVTKFAIPTVKYKIGYGQVIGSGDRPNMIWSAGSVKKAEVAEQDCGAIKEAKKCYIIDAGLSSSKWEIMHEHLDEYGSIELIGKVYGTKLWKYEEY